MKIIDAVVGRDGNSLVRVQYVKKILVEQQETLFSRANRLKQIDSELAGVLSDDAKTALSTERARIVGLKEAAFEDEQLDAIKTRCDLECDFDVKAQESAKTLIGREV